MITNLAGRSIVKRSESLRLQAYQDDCGVWTIGWGHTGGVVPGSTITTEQADAFLAADMAHAETGVWTRVGSCPTSSNQFSAMVSLAYNIGIGAFATSTVLHRHLAGLFLSAADGFLWWDKEHVDGALVESRGLLARRQAERALYLLADVAEV
jgi:lysozyme